MTTERKETDTLHTSDDGEYTIRVVKRQLSVRVPRR